QVASNRRYPDEAGKIQFNRTSATRDPKIRSADGGLIDPDLKTLSFWDDDTPLVAMSFYATHPMSYYGKGGVSADFVVLARRLRKPDARAVRRMYVSGGGGTVTAGKYNDGSPENRPLLADRIYKAMKEAWKRTKREPIARVTFQSVPLKLEARSSKGFSEEELLRRLKEDPRPFGQCLAALGLSWRKRVESGQAIDLPLLDFGK